jgi:hypothetical protein
MCRDCAQTVGLVELADDPEDRVRPVCSVLVRKAFANCGHWLAQWPFTGIGSKRSSDRISRKFLADTKTVKMDKFNFSSDNSTLTLTAPSMSI